MRRNYQELLLKQDRKLYHTADLAVLFGITNKNTLYKAISRMVIKKTLYPIYKGMYSTITLPNQNPQILGAFALNTYCYLSTESILFVNGIINQPPTKITFISGLSKEIQIDGICILSRSLKPEFLHNTAGILQNEAGNFVATTERAVSDLLYFSPDYYLDNPKLVDWEEVKKIQREMGFI